jgi:hypothetical protein
MSIIIDGTNGITLPSGTVSNPTSTLVGINDTQTLTNKSIVASQLTGTIAGARLPAGSVLQVVNGFTSTSVTTTVLDTWVDTGIIATITPTSASSKIMVIVNICGMVKSDTHAYNRMGIRLLRGATVLGVTSLRNLYTNTTMQFSLPGAMYSKLDSPSTTNATVYGVQFLQESPGTVGGVSVQKDGNSGESQIFLMEIAA